MDNDVLMNHEETGFPNPTKKGDLIMTCYFWLENGCSFDDGEWSLNYKSHKGGLFDMNRHPEILRESLCNQHEFVPNHEVLYVLEFQQVFEDDGWPHIMERFDLIEISIDEDDE